MLRTRVRPFYLVLLLLTALTTACVALPPQPEEPAMNALQAKQPAAAAEAAPAAALSSEEAATASTSATAAITAITGQVAYLPRIALPPDAVIEVELQDISRADAPARVVGQQRIETGGQQVPIPFVVEYDLSQIDPDGVYVLVARISEGGTTTWTNPDLLRVITGGAITDQVEILVQQVDN